MRSSLLLFFLFIWGLSYGQGSGFSFNYNGPTQIIVGPDCLEPLDWGHPNTPTAQSNLPGGMIVSFDIYSISGGYEIDDPVPGGTTVTVFYQAIDNFGNSALFGFSIAFIDVLPPVFDPQSLPSNMTVNCTGNFPVANVEASDNCEDFGNILTITFTETNNAQPCTGGAIVRKWVADDDLGNTSQFIQTINVLPDNTPPAIVNNLQNGSAPCANAMALYSTWLNTQRANFMATDNGCGIMSLTDNAPPPSQITSFCGVITVTFTAKDNCNNISTVIKTFTVTNNVAPVITTPASGASGDCGQSNINQIFNNWINTHGGALATDDCSSIFWTTSPPSPSIQDTCDAAIFVMFIAGDGCGNYDTTSASFILTDDTPPTITMEPTTMILSCSSSTVDSLLMDWLIMFGHSEAHDLCTSDDDLVAGYRIAGNELTLQEVLEVWQDSLASGCKDNVVIDGVGLNNVKAYIEVFFTYDDLCDNESGDKGFFGITDNGKPIFLTQPADTAFACSQNENWQDVFMDWYDTAGGATYMDVCSQVTVNASITADSALQYLTVALDTACMQGVAVSIQFTLVDDCGNESLTMPIAAFSLQDTLPPVLTTPASDFIASCSANGQDQLNNWLDTLGGATATDGCGDLLWTFAWVDTSGQVMTGLPDAGPYPLVTTLDCSGGLEVIFTASDVCQNTVSDTATFSIIDTLPPVIIIAEDTIHLDCKDTIPSTTPQITDACNGAIIITSTDSVGIDTCPGLPEVVIRIWTATDECGNSSSAQEVFLRIDTIPPTFQLPSDSVEFCSVDTLSLINVGDNCDPSPASTFEDVVSGPACSQLLIRTWTVTDACGNTATAVQQFDLSDSTPPEITYSPGHLVYTCSDGVLQEIYEQWMDSVVLADGCSATDYFIALKGSYILADTNTWPGAPLPDSLFLTCVQDISISADLVAYDACGNVIVEEISFSVNDTTGPVFINCISLIQVLPDTATCTGLVNLVVPEVEELCYPSDVNLVLIIDSGDTISLDSITMIDTILEVGIHTALWVATDCKGNAGTCLTTIEIIDENAVSLTCPSDTLLFASADSCTSSLYVYPPLASLGGCAKGVVELRFEIIGNAEPDSVVFSSVNDSVLVAFGAGVNQVLLIARDSTGDIDTCIYFVELRDTIDPVIICQNAALYLHPAGIEDVDLSTTALVVSTSDNCGVNNVIYDPPTVNCDSSGLDVLVTMTVFDQSGNTATCVNSLFVATLPLIPLWERGLCDDTLRLFANIPPGPDVNYMFTWSGPNSFASTDENPLVPDADTSFSGIYSVTVVSDSGCVSMGSVEVLIETLVSPVIILPDDTICTGEEIILTTQNYSGDVSYQWNQVTPDGDTIVSITSEPLFNFIPSAPGDYSFYAVVSQDTCTSEPGPDVNLFVASIPVVAIAEISMPLCIDDTLFLSPQVVVDSLLYIWSGPNGFESFIASPPGIPASTLESGDLFILIASSDLCSSLPDTISILIQLSPETPFITGDTLACEDGTFTLDASTEAGNYEWIDPLSNSIFTSDDTLNVVSATTDHSGGWRVIAYINGCPSDTSDLFAVQVDSALEVSIVAPDRVCEGDSLLLSVVPANDANYTWSGPGGFVSNDISPTTLAAEGIYIVFVETATGCEATDSHAVALDILPSITSLESDASPCADGETDIRLWAITDPMDPGAYIYHWDGPNGFSAQDSSPFVPDFNAGLNGVYTLFVINGTCTSETASITINVIDIPAAPVIIGETAYCYGDTIVLNIDSPAAGGVYTWTSSDTIVVVASPGTLILPNAVQGMTGLYNVHVTVDGCTSEETVIGIQVKAALSAPVITSPSLVCEGDSLILTSNAPAGAELHWVGPNGFESNEVSPFIYPAQPSNAGVYTMYYILNGCASSTTSSADVTIQSTIGAPALFTDISSICIDDPVPVLICIDPQTLTAGAQYSWFLNGSVLIVGPGSDSCIMIEGPPLQGGLNLITSIATLQGCLSDTSTGITIIGDVIPSGNADAGVNMQYCPGENILLDATDPSPAIGEWTSPSGFITFDDIHDPGTSIGSPPPGLYGMTWTLSFASCLNYSSDSVFIYVIPSPEVLPDTVDVPFGQTVEFAATSNDTLSGIAFTLEIVSSTLKGNVLHAGNGVFRYTPNLGFVGTDMMIYRICSTDCPEECSEAIVILRVGSEDDCFTPTLFTPNEDGVNDILIVPCLETERFPQNKIIIFNEWGDAVFTASPYLNDWDGRLSGDPLPVGTYFYIMDFGDGSEPKRSFLVLER